ncbi:endo-1,4-beta-xylanase A precursor [Sulfolobus monocaudavirus SMV2]|uniref:endo-1,4-beta-xylanase A precursor n=1 Tax=Sulfolobus monocaudavirus SMV2 TaxID=1580591 RepID=UPI0006D2ED12|nr:endo-1,4-beta-xylanase A precursor [Sulfolobus monocaudavirus SMV2]AIZ11348.1 endo-1,4-beta-xylanase A precursor [Sulfolobus monocaudavirus SMV2]
MSQSQKPNLYLLSLYPSPVGVTVTGDTTDQTVSFVISPYHYVDISYLITSYNDGVQVYAPDANIPQSGISGFPPGVPTVTLIIEKGNLNFEFATPEDILKSYLYNNILQNMNNDLTEIYQDLITLISEYASGQSLSQSYLSEVSSLLQQINNMLQNAEQFENTANLSFEGVSALQQVYNNLNEIYNSLTNQTLTLGELESLQLPSYSTPEASSIASNYTQFLNNAVSIMQNASSQSGSSSSSSQGSNSSSSTPQSSSSSNASSQSGSSSSPSPLSSLTTNSQSGTSSSSYNTQTSTSSTTTITTSTSTSSTTSQTSIISPPTLSQSQVLAQIQAGDVSSLLSELSEIPSNMIPVVNTVVQLYQLYGFPDGTPLSTVVERLLSDIREAYYNIVNHKQEEVNLQQLSQLLQLYNTLVSNGLAPQSQSASKLSELTQTSEIIPALPPVLGQPYPGRVNSNSNSNSVNYSNFI